MRERMIFSTNVAKTTGYPHTKELIWIFPYATHKINSICVIDLNLRAKTINVLEDNIEGNLLDLGLCKAFLDNTKITNNKEKQIYWTEPPGSRPICLEPSSVLPRVESA